LNPIVPPAITVHSHSRLFAILLAYNISAALLSVVLYFMLTGQMSEVINLFYFYLV